MSPEEFRLRNKVKNELRRRMKAVRGAIPGERRQERSEAIVARIVETPEWKEAKIVAGFVAIRGEVDPRGLGEDARKHGKTVALPRVDLEAQRIVLHAHTPGAPLIHSGFGVPEPSPEAPEIAPEDVDFVAVPGLAIDPRGHRIGYGKGFYDRLLPTLTKAFRCALIYDLQLIPEVPNMPNDVPVHAVATDQQLLRIDGD